MSHSRTRSTLDIKADILPSAIAAPSAHNTQPWQFKIGENALEVYVDWQRHLAVSDPTKRELYISLGCALMNIRVAAAHAGFTATITLVPEGENANSPAARVTFAPGADAQSAELFPAISTRRNDRRLYDAAPLSAKERSRLDAYRDPATVLLIEDRPAITQIADLTAQGTFETLARKDFKTELSAWIRHNWTQRGDGMPGYAIQIPAPMSLVAPLMIKMAPIHKQEGPKAKRQVESASAVVVIVSQHDRASDWLSAGESLQKLWLAATLAGLSAAAHASAIEASPELRQQLQATVRTSQLPQALIRLGHQRGAPPRPTPRRRIDDCLHSSLI